MIANGRGSMPKFGGSTGLSDEQITAVARYEREVLGANVSRSAARPLSAVAPAA